MSKPAGLADLIRSTQGSLISELGDAFVPRPVPDVHATVVGLDETLGDLPAGREIDALHDDGGSRPLALLQHLATALAEHPMQLRLGGFRDRDYPLTSRGRRLYERTVTVSGDKIVLMGWPVDGEGVPTGELDRLRRESAAYGFLHRYHSSPDATDPDGYLVLGELVQEGAVPRAEQAASRLRAEAAEWDEVFRLGVDEVGVAFYESTLLPGSTTSLTALRDVAAPRRPRV